MNITDTDLAYAAGAIDADGCFTIKRTRQRCRENGNCINTQYRGRILLGQITPQVPALLKKMFKGSIYLTKPGTENSRPLYRWMVSDKTAYETAKTIIPYLRIKQERASCVIELHELRQKPRVRTAAYWYELEHPNWKSEPMITTKQAADMLGLVSAESISQAISNGTLLSASPGRHGRSLVPKIPRGLVEILLTLKSRKTKFLSPPQLIDAMQAIWERLRQMNTLGIKGTCVNHRTGAFSPKD